MAPNNMAKYQSKPKRKCAATPVNPAVTNTPHVAKVIAGFKPVRKVLNSVRKPPSSKITAKAKLPTQKLSLKSLKTKPPGPSSPAKEPASKNTNKKENPARADKTPATTLMSTSNAAANRGSVRNSCAGNMTVS